jgi:hypothetical protein
MGTLQTETFTSNGANASGRFYDDERPVENGTAGAGALTIAYDAGTQSYTITTAGRTATFAPADLVGSGSPDFVSYEKISTTSEALTMTRPGTSGALTYRYVSGGAWERATITGDQLDFSYDPFTYGVETPDNALVRSGTGLYAVSLVGARAMDAPYAMAGSGTMQVDFLGGSLTSSGVLTSIDVETGLIKSIGVYFGSGALSSTTNDFTGAFFMDDGKRFTGGWDGRFYGPDAEEVGATWYLRSADGEAAAGYLIGREDATVAGLNTTLTALVYDDLFEHQFSQVGFTDLGTGNSATGFDDLRAEAELRYAASTQSYRYVDSARSIDTSFTPANLVAGETTDALAVYRMTAMDGLTYKLSLNKAGSGNSTIALTYASFGHWERLQAAGSDKLDRWFTYGIRTNGFQIPSGTGTYVGIIRGTANRFNGGALYSLAGTANFALDFGNSSFTGSISPVGTSLADGSTRNFGSFTFARGAIDLDAGLNADIVNGSNAYLGYFQGALYGPTASEIGGSFGMQTENTDSGSAPGANAAYLTGVIVGTRTGN